MRVGYRRVSSVDQSLARQDLGDCERVFEEKLSGSSANRPALQEMIAFVRNDDEVVVQLAGTFAADRFIVIKNKTKNPVVSAAPHPYFDYETKTFIRSKGIPAPEDIG